MSESPTLIREIDYLLADRRQLAAEGPHFKIIHSFGLPAAYEVIGCVPGEALVGVWLTNRGREYQLPFSTTTGLLFDYFARHRWTWQTAGQIERAVRGDVLFLAWRRSSKRRRALPHRTSIKGHVRRIRLAIASTFSEAGLVLGPESVMVSRPTVGNEVVYQLRASIDCIHIGALG